MMVCFLKITYLKLFNFIVIIVVDAILPENLDEVDQEVPPQLLFVHQVIILSLFSKSKIKIIFFLK